MSEEYSYEYYDKNPFGPNLNIKKKRGEREIFEEVDTYETDLQQANLTMALPQTDAKVEEMAKRYEHKQHIFNSKDNKYSTDVEKLVREEFEKLLETYLDEEECLTKTPGKIMKEAKNNISNKLA